MKLPTSPIISLLSAYCYILLVGFILYTLGYYRNNEFFYWGPPIRFFNKEITTNKEFYCIHILVFFHQLFNNYVNSVTYPWIINSIQDPKNKILTYSKFVSIMLINFFDLYSELDTMLIIIGLVSQISFLLTLSIANIISSTLINLKYINQKYIIPSSKNNLNSYTNLNANFANLNENNLDLNIV